MLTIKYFKEKEKELATLQKLYEESNVEHQRIYAEHISRLREAYWKARKKGAVNND